MTGAELKAIREDLCCGIVEFGYAIGYTGTPNTVSVLIRRYESGARPIPPLVARLSLMFALHWIPAAWLGGDGRLDKDTLDAASTRPYLLEMMRREVDEQRATIYERPEMG